MTDDEQDNADLSRMRGRPLEVRQAVVRELLENMASELASYHAMVASLHDLVDKHKRRADRAERDVRNHVPVGQP